MSTPLLICRHCDSSDVVRNGHTRNGKQRYVCKACRRSSRSSPETQGGYSPEQRETILRSYYERPSLRRIERTFGISRVTLIKWRKQDQHQHSLLHVSKPTINSLIP